MWESETYASDEIKVLVDVLRNGGITSDSIMIANMRKKVHRNEQKKRDSVGNRTRLYLRTFLEVPMKENQWKPTWKSSLATAAVVFTLMMDACLMMDIFEA